MFREPRHGEDYLIDFYAVLGVERNADGETIRKAYLKQTRAYHTDQYQSLAPELKAQAEAKMQILNQAKETLSDPKIRKEYDEQLAHWTGPISETGMPILDLSKPFFSSIPLLSGATEQSQVIEEQTRVAAQISGHDQNTFELLEKLYKESDAPSPKLEAAYREALRKRDVCLELELQIHWEALGCHNKPSETNLSAEDYLKKVQDELVLARGRVIADLGEKLALIQGGTLKALGPGGEELTQALASNPEQTLADYRALIAKRFDTIGAGKISELARERQGITEQRMQAVEQRYWPEQSEFFPRILVCVKVGENHVWLAFASTGETKVETDDSVDTKALSSLLVSEEEARSWLEKGYNILLFKAEENINIREQLRTVLSRHFEKVASEDVQ